MQTKLRTKIAAAALMLAPVAALVAAQPAAAQQRHDDHRYEQDRDHRDGRDHRDVRDVRADRRAPEIFNVAPDAGDRVRDPGSFTHVSAHFRDDASGVDARSVVFRVDGRNLTRWANVTEGEVSARVELAPGRHVADVEVRDRAGNVAHKSWTFAVAGHGGRRWD